MEAKDRIREKAQEMFLKYGIRSISMDDIAAQLGMSKKTIYQYYTDKDELVDAVVNSEINEMQHDCLGTAAKAENAIDELLMTMDMIVEQLSNMNPMLLYDMEKFHPQSFLKFKKHKNEFLLRIIRANLERGKEEGFFRKDINTDVISRYRLESMMIAFNISVFPPNRYNLAEVSREVILLYLYGITTVKGHQLVNNALIERKKIPQQ